MTATVVARAAPGPVVAAWPLRVVAAGGLAVAAGAHFAAFPAHRSEGVVTAGLFLVVAVIQLATALFVARGLSAALRLGVVVGNLSILALWVWSRTAGIPLGSHAGVAEAVGLLDLSAAGAQTAAIVAMVMLPRTWTRHPTLGLKVALLAVTAVVAIGGAGLVPSAHADHPHDATKSSSVTPDALATIATAGARDAGDVAPSGAATLVETPSSAPQNSSAGEPEAGHRHGADQNDAEPHTHP